MFSPENLASIDATDKDGNTALHRAVNDKNIATIKKLIKDGANFAALNNIGQSPLQLAASYSMPDCVIAILDNLPSDTKQERLSQCFKDGEMALIDAVISGHIDSVRALIAAQADINITFEDVLNAKTPLKIAINSNKTDVAKLLLEAKADPNQKNKDGKSLLEIAILYKNLPFVKALINAGATYDENEKKIAHINHIHKIVIKSIAEYKKNRARPASTLSATVKIDDSKNNVEETKSTKNSTPADHPHTTAVEPIALTSNTTPVSSTILAQMPADTTSTDTSRSIDTSSSTADTSSAATITSSTQPIPCVTMTDSRNTFATVSNFRESSLISATFPASESSQEKTQNELNLEQQVKRLTDAMAKLTQEHTVLRQEYETLNEVLKDYQKIPVVNLAQFTQALQSYEQNPSTSSDPFSQEQAVKSTELTATPEEKAESSGAKFTIRLIDPFPIPDESTSIIPTTPTAPSSSPTDAATYASVTVNPHKRSTTATTAHPQFVSLGRNQKIRYFQSETHSPPSTSKNSEPANAPDISIFRI